MKKEISSRSCIAIVEENGVEREVRNDDVLLFIKQIMSTLGLYQKCKNKYGNYALEFKNNKDNDIVVKRIYYTTTGEIVYNYALENPFIKRSLYVCFLRCLSGFSQVVSKTF